MKHLIVSLLLLGACQLAWSQANPGNRFLETDHKSHLYYVDLNHDTAKVYEMGYYYDKAGMGYAIADVRTLQKQPDSSYNDGHFRIAHENDGLYLVRMFGKNKKFRLNTARDTNLVNNRLNNACYLGGYFMMCRKLSQRYPLSSLNYSEAYFTWRALPENEKNMHYMEFSVLAGKRFKERSDSISAEQDNYVRLTNYLIGNIRSLDYATLKDSLILLPARQAGQSKYYSTVIDTVALQQPEYFFRLAEDLPQHRSLIFSSGGRNKRVFSSLLRVEGYDEIKRDFIKARRSEKAFAIYAVGMSVFGYAIIAGLIIAIL
jgi:hypothetical protein